MKCAAQRVTALGIALLGLAPVVAFAATVDLQAVVCRVDGAPIRLADVRGAVNRLLPMQSFHGNVDKATVRKIARQAMQTEIDELLELRDAGARGIDVSSAEVDQALEKLKARYKDEAGFKAKRRKLGVTIPELRERLRRRRLLEKVRGQVEKSTGTVTAEEARAYYESHRDSFHEPRRIELGQIFFKMPPTGRSETSWKETEQKAAAAKARIQAGEPFEDLVAELSEAPQHQKKVKGVMGVYHKGQLPKFLATAGIWDLPVGGLSEPIRSFYGVHLIKVERALAPRQVPFTEVADSLRKYLQKKRTREQVKQWQAALRAKAKIEYLDPYFAPVKAPVAAQ